MARSRNLKPGFFLNEELAQLPHGARLLFQGLWLLADREGRLKDNVDLIKGQIFPFEKVPTDKWLDLLAARRFIVRYDNGGRAFIQVTNFLKHQRPHIKESESVIPAPTLEQCSAPTLSSVEPGLETVRSTYIGRGDQQEGIRNQESDRGRERFEPPAVEAVAAYCLERKNGLDAQHFVDFYTSKGWRVGNQPMKDWKASVRTWERNPRSNGKHRAGAGQTHDPEATKKDPNHGRM